MARERKKILYLVTKGNWGGAQRYVFDLASHLPVGLEPVVALGQGAALEAKLTARNMRVIHVPSLQRNINPVKDIRAFLDILKIIRREHPAILHLNSTKAGGLGALAGRIAGVPRIIFTAHGWTFNEHRPLPQKVVITALQWLTVLLSHVTVAVSQHIQAQMSRFPFTSSKIL